MRPHSPPSPPEGPSRARRRASRGFVAALAAYLAWALFPAYFKMLRAVPPLEILAHRVAWSLAFLTVLVTLRRRWGEIGPSVKGLRLLPYVASTLLLSANWLVFIWAVNSGRVLQASLGYFINPLVNVLLGFAFLRERLYRAQAVAVALAAAGVLVLVLRAGEVPWVSLSLAATFGGYGLVRKKARIDALLGLLVETALLAPVALLYLHHLSTTGRSHFAMGGATAALLAASGVLTAVPLIWFAIGVRSLRLSTMGLLQYVSPSGQFLLAVALYREPFTATHALAFLFIWTSLAIYSWDALRARPSG